MAYTKEMEKQGRWLFKWRSYMPLALLGLLPFAVKDSSYFSGSVTLNRVWELTCFAIAIFGLALRIFTVGFVADGTSGRTTSCPKATELNTTGMYSVVRHPLYLANFIVWLGLAMFVHSILLAVCCVFAFWLYYERIIVAEEAFLREKFKTEFTQWANNTPAAIPDFKLWKKPGRRFSWRMIMRREYPGVLTITASFAALDAIIDRVREKIWQPDWLWMTIFFTGLLIFIIFRTLRKLRITDLAEKRTSNQFLKTQRSNLINSPEIN